GARLDGTPRSSPGRCGPSAHARGQFPLVSLNGLAIEATFARAAARPRDPSPPAMFPPPPAHLVLPADDGVDGGDGNRMIRRSRLAINPQGAFFSLRRLDQLGVERLKELAPAHRRQELLQARSGRLVAIADRHHQPLERDLRVARPRKTESLLQLLHPLTAELLRQRLQEVQPLLR